MTPPPPPHPNIQLNPTNKLLQLTFSCMTPSHQTPSVCYWHLHDINVVHLVILCMRISTSGAGAAAGAGTTTVATAVAEVYSVPSRYAAATTALEHIALQSKIYMQASLHLPASRHCASS